MQGVSGIAHVIACYGVGEELWQFVEETFFMEGKGREAFLRGNVSYSNPWTLFRR